MNPKHQQFVTEYLKCWCGADAYQRVYPKANRDTARANAAALLANTSISSAIKQRIAENAMSADEVLARLGRHARGTMADFLTIDPLIGDPTVDLAKAQERDQLDLLKDFTVEERTVSGITTRRVSIKLQDQQSALQLLGKHLGLFGDNLNVKLTSELERFLDQLEHSLDPDTFATVLSIIAGKVGREAVEGYAPETGRGPDQLSA